MEITVKDVLERNESENRNDIWTFLHDDRQEWYFRSEMGIDKAYVFDTLGMAHGAAILPGEKQAENYIRCLQACRDVIENRDDINNIDAAKLAQVAGGYKQQLPKTKQLTKTMTRPLALALERMENLLNRASAQPEALLEDAQAWLDGSRQVIDSLIRKSIELRAVALVY